MSLFVCRVQICRSKEGNVDATATMKQSHTLESSVSSESEAKLRQLGYTQGLIGTILPQILKTAPENSDVSTIVRLAVERISNIT